MGKKSLKEKEIIALRNELNPDETLVIVGIFVGMAMAICGYGFFSQSDSKVFLGITIFIGVLLIVLSVASVFLRFMKRSKMVDRIKGVEDELAKLDYELNKLEERLNA